MLNSSTHLIPLPLLCTRTQLTVFYPSSPVLEINKAICGWILEQELLSASETKPHPSRYDVSDVRKGTAVTTVPPYHVRNPSRLSLRFSSKAARQNPERKAWVRGYHMVLVRPGGDRRVKKTVREPKWSSPSVIVLESEDGNKGTLHQKRVRQRRKSLTDTRTTLRSLSETLQTTALPSSPLYLVHSTYTLHVVTTDIYLHISRYSSARGILCACVFLVVQRSQFAFVCMYVCMYVCMCIRHTLISVGSLLARAYRHDVHVGTL